MSSTPVLAPKGSPAVAPVLVPGHSRLSLRRAMAMLVLPASIVPVIFLGPTLLRSPQRLVRQAAAEVQRLEGPPAHHRGRAPLTGRAVLETELPLSGESLALPRIPR